MMFMLRPRRGSEQWVVRDQYTLQPTVAVEEGTDGFGNLYQRLVAPRGEFVVQTDTEVLVAPADEVDTYPEFVPVPQLPADVLTFLLPSRYCESDRFSDMASEIVGDVRSGYAQVEALSSWVRRQIRNVPLSSTYPVSAVEVNQRREGVCRDLAHMLIALSRALCIPARLVVGFVHDLDPMDIHAWCEVYLAGRWWMFDPAFAPQNDARIALARGRDAADVAVYNQYGPLLLPTDMSVEVTRL